MNIRDVLRDLLVLAERDEVQIDGEWGRCRSIEQIEADGDLPEAIIQARNALRELK